ncbi:MAG: hypothetical protein COA33_014600 [Fluviicola sp.]|nr:hypothetical protein [Fluviicola sp.]
MEEEVVKATKFQSPVPFLRQFRNFIFGKKKPDVFTRLTFNINMIIWISFLLWSVISYFTISSREMVYRFKGIPVDSILKNRGVELGFEGPDFLSRLLTFNGIAVICWSIVFIGLILLFRKKKQFIYFVLGGTVFYLGMSIFYLSFTYFMEDTTMYDKIALLVVIVSSIIHSYLMKNEREGGSINFFGENENEVEAIE